MEDVTIDAQRLEYSVGDVYATDFRGNDYILYDSSVSNCAFNQSREDDPLHQGQLLSADSVIDRTDIRQDRSSRIKLQECSLSNMSVHTGEDSSISLRNVSLTGGYLKVPDGKTLRIDTKRFVNGETPEGRYDVSRATVCRDDDGTIMYVIPEDEGEYTYIIAPLNDVDSDPRPTVFVPSNWTADTSDDEGSKLMRRLHAKGKHETPEEFFDEIAPRSPRTLG